MKNTSFGIAAVPFLLLSAACAREPWTIVHQAIPDPFLGKGSFTLEKIHFEQAQIGDRQNEGAFLADKDPKERADWDEAKRGMNENFSQGVASRVALADGAPYAVRPIIAFADPGKYAFVYSRNTVVNMTVQLLDVSSQKVLDEFQIETAVAASLYDPSADHRLREASLELGRIAARYIRKRIESGS